MKPDLDQSRYTLTSSAYYFDWAAIPVAIGIALWWLSTVRTANAELVASAAVWGAGLWTFLEYAIHRFVFHRIRPYNFQHQIHHAHPADFIGVSPLVTIALFVLLGFAMPAILGASAGVGFYAGVLTAYLAYIVMHDAYHHRRLDKSRWGFVRRLEHNHHWHHARNRVNFGVTSPVWDFVFGTYSKPIGARRYVQG